MQPITGRAYSLVQLLLHHELAHVLTRAGCTRATYTAPWGTGDAVQLLLDPEHDMALHPDDLGGLHIYHEAMVPVAADPRFTIDTFTGVVAFATPGARLARILPTIIPALEHIPWTLYDVDTGEALHDVGRLHQRRHGPRGGRFQLTPARNSSRGWDPALAAQIAQAVTDRLPDYRAERIGEAHVIIVACASDGPFDQDAIYTAAPWNTSYAAPLLPPVIDPARDRIGGVGSQYRTDRYDTLAGHISWIDGAARIHPLLPLGETTPYTLFEDPATEDPTTLARRALEQIHKRAHTPLQPRQWKMLPDFAAQTGPVDISDHGLPSAYLAALRTFASIGLATHSGTTLTPTPLARDLARHIDPAGAPTDGIRLPCACTTTAPRTRTVVFCDEEAGHIDKHSNTGPRHTLTWAYEGDAPDMFDSDGFPVRP